MKKKSILIFISVLVVITGIYYYTSGNKKAVIEWRTAKAEQGDLKITVTATGTLNALITVQVGTQVSGIISKLYADFNSIVKKGQVIAELDKTSLAASVEDAEANLQRSQVQLNQAKREYDRTNKLFEDKVVAQADYDQALTNYETAESNLRSAKAQLNRAKVNLQYATITAPISGIVISRNVDIGQTVAASFNTPTLFTIANDLTKMQVEANIDEADIGQVKVGQQVSFTVDAYNNETFTGEIKQVRLQPNVIQNVVNYTVIIDVPNPDMKLMPGMTASITVNIEARKNIIKIPVSAFRFLPPENYVKQNISASIGSTQGIQTELIPGDTATIWAKEGNDIVSKKVIIGLSDGSFAEVKGEISTGDDIVIGMNSEQNSSSQQKNPFMPQMPRGRR